MRAKIILAVFLILGIIGLLFFTQQGRVFLNSLNKNIPPTFSSLLTLFSFQKPSENYFPFSLQISRNSLSDSFEAVNSTFLTQEGITIFLNNIPLTIPENSSLRIENCQGRFDINEKIKASLSAKRILIDEIAFGPSDLKVEFEAPLQKALIAGARKDVINFSSISGKLEQLAEDGSVKHSVTLANDGLKISNFFGSIRFEKDLVYLYGCATKIQGKNFEWFS
jgi:hypothetical protein